MIRRFTILILAVVFSSALLAQTVVKIDLAIIGVSPRDVAKSTTDIYTFASTGLNNVGVGGQIYLQASIIGKKFGTVTYTLTRRPSGSTSVIGTTKDIRNDSTQVITYTPDKVGAYEITVTDGGYTKTVTFNAQKYLGYMNTMVAGADTKVNCKTCHSSYVAKWEKTNHSTLFTKAMSATPGISGPADHYSNNCVKCHTTGYDANPTALNDGFDDLGWVYPTTVTSNTYNELLTKYPEAMKRGNIQCESCHGPAGGHLGSTSDFRIQATFDADVCAFCHDSGTNHIFPEQWDASLHSGATAYPSGAGREQCVRCHTGKGFAQFTQGIQYTDPYFDVSYTPITCAGCHDPHDATNERQLRRTKTELYFTNVADTTKPLYKEVTGFGMGTVCVNCHQSRSEAQAALKASISSRFGPHYANQGDMIYGNNLLELGGFKLTKTNHIGYTGNACVTCHMYTGTSVIDGKVKQWGGHSFSMSTFKKDASGNFILGPDHRRVKDEDNMQACAPCHGNTFGPNFKDVKFFINNKGDHDNDGIVEGLQLEIEGMVGKVMAELGKIPGVAFSAEYGQWIDGKFKAFPVPSSKWTKTQLQAYWNSISVHNDKSGGIHNPKYAVSAMKGAMTLLKIPVGVEEEIGTVPTTFALYQNYPNPFNPTTNIKFSLPKTGNVKLVVYDAVGREVATLVNNTLVAGTHTIQFNANGLASGIYLCKIETRDFVKVNKMLLVK